jgi:hypothetical protein
MKDIPETIGEQAQNPEQRHRPASRLHFHPEVASPVSKFPCETSFKKLSQLI